MGKSFFEACLWLFLLALLCEGLGHGFHEEYGRYRAGLKKKLRHPLAAKAWKFRRRCLGGVLLAAALWIGNWANEVSRTEAELKWERTHLPTDRVLDFALGSRGVETSPGCQTASKGKLLFAVESGRGGFCVVERGCWMDGFFFRVRGKLAGPNLLSAMQRVLLGAGSPKGSGERIGAGHSGDR